MKKLVTDETVVRVGQRWRYLDSPRTYEIARIENNVAYWTGGGVFAGLTPSGCVYSLSVGVYSLSVGWSVEEPDEIVAPMASDGSLLSFFAQVPSGHCACNMPRAACEYHR